MSKFFDRLAKTAAGGVSRRDALKGLAGLLAGGFLAALPGKARADDDGGDDDDQGNEEINETCKKYCKKCPKGGGDGDDGEDEGVRGKCMSHCKRFLHRHPTAKPCGTCTAKTPFTACVGTASCCTPTAGNYCANLQTDVKNCGKCGTTCTGTTPACCSGVCKDLSNDVNNCGKCGNKCSGTSPTCTKGVCG